MLCNIQKHNYLSLFLFVFLFGATCSEAFAFGTVWGRPIIGIKGWYFYMEHGNIVTAALSCSVKDPVPNCFEPKTMRALSGDGTSFGAVGAADNYSYDFSGPTEWHCSEADYIPPTINGKSTGFQSYPTTLSYAQGVLQRCRNFARNEFLEGDPIGTGGTSWTYGNYGGVLGSARYYFTTNNSYSGPISTNKTWISGASLATCNYNYSGGLASGGKCYVLNALGRGLHVVMDFYAHTNWGDTEDKTIPISIDNPPGLGNKTIAPFWENLDEPMPWTEGLSSGCYGKESRGLPAGVSSSDCSKRTLDLDWRNQKYVGYSKDVAQFDPLQGSQAIVKCNDSGDIASGSWKGCQPRGSLRLNDGTLVQQNVTTLAILEVRRQWEWIQKKIHEKFGQERGDTIICYITKDEEAKCPQPK
jgi:hypothetical protein